MSIFSKKPLSSFYFIFFLVRRPRAAFDTPLTHLRHLLSLPLCARYCCWCICFSCLACKYVCVCMCVFVCLRAWVWFCVCMCAAHLSLNESHNRNAFSRL